jgi:hypothetical protein
MEHCLFNVPICNPDLVVPQLQINATKVLNSSQPIIELINSRKWIVVLDGNFI